MKKAWVLVICLTIQVCLYAQLKRYKVGIIAFYNLENLYDTINNPMINDDEFTPAGDKHYSGQIYLDKLDKLATIISRLGPYGSPGGPALLGVAEIENDTVLTDLINRPLLKRKNYRFIHYDSKDSRGIDVAFIYDPVYFIPVYSETLFVKIPGGSKEAGYTRDILYVNGLFDGECIHLYINHWPSRRGGEERSSPAREAAAAVCKQHSDDIFHKDPTAKIIIMGDLNDDPCSRSITHVLKAGTTASCTLFNPWVSLYNRGIGTLANRDVWGLFDQIIISKSWLSQHQSGFYFHERHIFAKQYMIEPTGRYKGYPMRTWEGNQYRGGYSDHFPTYLVLLKKAPATH